MDSYLFVVRVRALALNSCPLRIGAANWSGSEKSRNPAWSGAAYGINLFTAGH